MIADDVHEAGGGETLLREKVKCAVPSCRIIVTELWLLLNDFTDVLGGEFDAVFCLNNSETRLQIKEGSGKRNCYHCNICGG